MCYVLGITEVNPEFFDLLFERFISVERGDPPDIDVDFEHERREEVLQYVYRRYGRDRAAMVANVITFRKKGALRAVGKALGIDSNIIDHVASSCRSKQSYGSSLQSILSRARSNLHHEDQDNTRTPWDLWCYLANQIKGFPRHLGIHSGGFIISQHPIDHLVPQEQASMDGRIVIQWCKQDIENLGFFKIDLLALGMLTAIRKCMNYIHEYSKKALC